MFENPRSDPDSTFVDARDPAIEQIDRPQEFGAEAAIRVFVNLGGRADLLDRAGRFCPPLVELGDLDARPTSFGALSLDGRGPDVVAVTRDALAALLAVQLSTLGAEIGLQTVLVAVVLGSSRALWRDPKRLVRLSLAGLLALLLAAPAILGVRWLVTGTSRELGFTLEEAREALAVLPALSGDGVERLLRIYGGRATGIAAIAKQRPELAGCIDEAATLPEAEIAFVIGEELPRTLIDIVYRRMMIGLDADQGRPQYGRIAELAAAEFGWDDTRRDAELHALRVHTDSLHVGRLEAEKLTS